MLAPVLPGVVPNPYWSPHMLVRTPTLLPGLESGIGGAWAVRHGRRVGRGGRRRSFVLTLLTAALLVLGLVGGTPPRAAAAPGDVGTEDMSHAGTGTPTGTKRAESVLWFNDGFWWGNLWDTTS